MDTFVMFAVGQRERLFSRELVAGLLARGERPWADLRRGRPVTEGWVAQQLRPYGVQSRTVRIGEQVAKGYAQADLMEVFRRYIPRGEIAAWQAEMSERCAGQAREARGFGQQGVTAAESN